MARQYLDKTGLSRLWEKFKEYVGNNAVGEKTADGGEIFNDYENNQALAQYAGAKGTMLTVSGIGAAGEGVGLVASTQKFLGISISSLSVKIASVSGNTLTTSATVGLDTILSNIGTTNGFVIKVGGQLVPIKSYTSSGTVSKTITMTSFNDTVDTALAGKTVEDLYLGVAMGDYSHHEGSKNLVLGQASHAEGELNLVTALGGHVEGGANRVTGAYGHAEGANNEASGDMSHVGGSDSTVEGVAGFGHGVEVHSIGNGAAALGKGTKAKGHYAFARGKYNIEEGVDADGWGYYADIVGNGSNDENRSNAYTLDWNGIGWFAEYVTVGANREKLATEALMLDNVNAVRNELNEQLTNVRNDVALENVKTGNRSVSITDIANLDHDVKIVLSPNMEKCENYITLPYYEGTSKTVNGITFTVNSDCSITVNGTAADVATFRLKDSFEIAAGGIYVMSGFPDGAYSAEANVYMYLRNNATNVDYLVFCSDGRKTERFVATADETNARVQITVLAGAVLDNVTFTPKIGVVLPTDAYVHINGDTVNRVYTSTGEITAASSYPSFYVATNPSHIDLTVTYLQSASGAIAELKNAIISMGGAI